MLEWIMNIVIVVIVMIFIVKIFKKIVINVPKAARVTEIDPTTTGERLKKYMIKASKLNPKTAKTLKLERTIWSEGGRIGRIHGAMPTKDCTRFIVKRGIFSRKNLFYCPTDMHTSLHNKEVMVNGTSIDTAGGYLYPIPCNGNDNKTIFGVIAEAFEADLRKMLTMDSLQMELEQTYQGIAGLDREGEFYEEPQEIIEYEKEGDDAPE